MKQCITVNVHLSDRVFRRFSDFDTFRMKRSFINPLLFFVGLGFFSVLSFCQTDKEQSVLLGAVLGGLAVLLPSVYFLLYRSSVSREIRTHGLQKKPLVYSLDFGRGEDGIKIHGTHGEPEVVLAWEKVYRAFRRKDCFYLYAVPAKAFLLPVDDLPVSAGEFGALLKDMLKERFVDLKGSETDEPVEKDIKG